MKIFSVIVVATACALLTACVSESDPEPTTTAEQTPSADTKDTTTTTPQKSAQADGPAVPVQPGVTSIQSASGGGPQPRQD